MLRKDMPKGIVIFEGPSLIDNKPIVVIANTFKRSANKKTGPMIQTWIMRSDIHPNDAMKTGEDFSVCGDCKHRGTYNPVTKRVEKQTCYVNVMHGPTSVWRTYKRTGEAGYWTYDSSMLKFFKGRQLRLGCYGDPAAVPISLWITFCNVAAGFTGYTHQWRTCDPLLKYFCMASVDTIPEQREAQLDGWSTFRVRPIDGQILPNEFICPASKEAGKKTTCAKCNICRGLSGKIIDRHPVIEVHGWKHKVRHFNNLIDNCV
jgi:hypothetical protein